MSDEGMSNFTPRAQQVLALARKEADRFNHNFVGTEHLLLGLIKLGQGVAVNVLQKMGLDLETVRLEVEKQVGTGPDQKQVGNIPYTPRVKKRERQTNEDFEKRRRFFWFFFFCVRVFFLSFFFILCAKKTKERRQKMKERGVSVVFLQAFRVVWYVV